MVHFVRNLDENKAKAAIASIAIAVIRMRRRKRRRRNRRIWTRQWILERERQGAYHHLLSEIQALDSSTYRNFLRMSSTTFEELLSMVGPRITYQDTIMRKAISAAERLAVTLRFLATGETFESLKYLYRIPAQTIGQIVPQTCQVIIDKLVHEYMKVPNTEQEWVSIAQDFSEKWNFNHCIGAMDGKHILIKPPNNSGSQYYNYKHSFSIVLLAIVDADYKFLFTDIGCNGRVSDGGVFKNCSIHQALEGDTLNIPKEEPLPNSDNPLPYAIVADDAFPLKRYIMKPYSRNSLTQEKRIFNYRLSRARRVVENAFGILSNRFRLFMTPIALVPEKVETITMACCALHNFLRCKVESQSLYMPLESLEREDLNTNTLCPGEWQQGPPSTALQPLSRQGSNLYSCPAKNIRNAFCEYFNTEGSVPWQRDMV